MGRPARSAPSAQRELVDVLAEQVEAGGLDAVHAVAEVDDVKIVLEDLILGQLAFEQARDSQLDQFAAQRAPVIPIGQEAVVRHLHRDRAEPLSNAARAEVARDGAHHAAPVEPVMFIEAPVLRGDERVPDVLRDHA